MALPDALLVLASHWAEAAARLSADRVATIRRNLAAAAHGAEWHPSDLIDAISGVEAEGAQFWDALARSSARRTAEAPAEVMAAVMELRLAIERYERSDVEQGERPDPQEVERAAEERVLLVPMARLLGSQAAASLLVVPHHGERLAPLFQFDQAGEPLGAAVEVNRILEASDDPWGVASWWLTPHASLQAIPADAVRSGRAPEVIAAARAVDALAGA